MSAFHYTREAGDQGQILAREGAATGLPLDELVERARPDLRAAFELGAALADLLCIAEEDRSVHGDLRTASVKIDEAGNVSVEGWGVPRRTTRAPEGRTDSASSDMYGLGIVLHSILSAEPFGELPKDADEHDDAVIDRVLGMDFSAAKGKRWLEDVRKFLCNILAWTPEDRPAPLDAANVLASVAAQVGGEGLAAWASRAARAGAAPPLRALPAHQEILGGPTSIAAPMARGGARQAPAAKGESTSFWSREKIAQMLAEEDDEPMPPPRAPAKEALSAPMARPAAPASRPQENLSAPMARPSSSDAYSAPMARPVAQSAAVPPPPPMPKPVAAPPVESRRGATITPELYGGAPGASEGPSSSAGQRPAAGQTSQAFNNPPARPATPTRSEPARPTRVEAAQPAPRIQQSSDDPFEDPLPKSIAGMMVGIALVVGLLLCGGVLALGGGAWFFAREEEPAAAGAASTGSSGSASAPGAEAASSTTTSAAPASETPAPPAATSTSKPAATPATTSTPKPPSTSTPKPATTSTPKPATTSTAKPATTTTAKPTTSTKAPAAAPPEPAASGPYSVRVSVPGKEGRIQCGDGQTADFVGSTSLQFTGTVTCRVKVDKKQGVVQIERAGTVTCSEFGTNLSCGM